MAARPLVISARGEKTPAVRAVRNDESPTGCVRASNYGLTKGLCPGALLDGNQRSPADKHDQDCQSDRRSLRLLQNGCGAFELLNAAKEYAQLRARASFRVVPGRWWWHLICAGYKAVEHTMLTMARRPFIFSGAGPANFIASAEKQRLTELCKARVL